MNATNDATPSGGSELGDDTELGDNTELADNSELVDETIVARTEAGVIEDATVAVAKDDVVDDATVAVAADQTVVVPSEQVGLDATVAVNGVVVGGAGGGAVADAAIVGPPQTASHTGGGPVVDGVEIPPSLAKLLFKKPLDPKRRAPESPFPKSQSSLPRGGVRPDIPVVYGARAEEVEFYGDGTDFARWIGPPPVGYELEAVDRAALPSTAKLNQQFRRIALFGGAGAIVVAAYGLWWVTGQLF